MNTLERARQALSLLDLTSLNDDDTATDIAKLCMRATSVEGSVAAVCVWPQFVAQAKAALASSQVRIAAVANFPQGALDIDRAMADTRDILSHGGDEVDVVFPYRAFLAGNVQGSHDLVSACARLCHGRAKLKVILETGEIAKAEKIRDASLIAIEAGANFIKTSTGKTPISATLEAAASMLETIKETGGHCGFKASGGIRDTETAIRYLELADSIMGEVWITPSTFRFGASGLLDSLLSTLKGRNTQSSHEGY